MNFTATVQLDGKTATGITVPDEIVEGLGAGRRPPVVVTINGYTYRTTLGVMKGVAKIPLSAQHRVGAGIAAGDEVTVTLEVDTAERTVDVPDDLADALKQNPTASAFFDSLSAGQQKLFTTWIASAKKTETRERRVNESLAKLGAQQTLR